MSFFIELEKNYVLKRLDEWYEQNFKLKFTPGLYYQFQQKIQNHLLGSKTLETAVKRDFFSDLQKQLFEDSQNFFSRNLRHLERSTHFSDLTHYYINLVENIRRKSDEIFPEDISNSDITTIYYETFGENENF